MRRLAVSKRQEGTRELAAFRRLRKLSTLLAPVPVSPSAADACASLAVPTSLHPRAPWRRYCTGGIGEDGESGRLELAYMACHAVPHWAHSRAANLPRQAWLLAPLPAEGMAEREQGASARGPPAPAAAPFLCISVHDSSMPQRPRKRQEQAVSSGGGSGGEGGKGLEGAHCRVRVGCEGGAEGAAEVGAQQRAAWREGSPDVLSEASKYVLSISRALATAARQGRIRSTWRLVRNFRLVEACYSRQDLVSALCSLGLAADDTHALSIIARVSLAPRPCCCAAVPSVWPCGPCACACLRLPQGSLRLPASSCAYERVSLQTGWMPVTEGRWCAICVPLVWLVAAGRQRRGAATGMRQQSPL